jgi:peptidoglycan/xylan/chitin deacetylase (PgdA/CDA1 family)
MTNPIWNRARNAFSERLTRNWIPNPGYSAAGVPLVSVTFDDFPKSAATTGARLLRDFGVKGTYFVAGGRSGRYLDGVDQFTDDDLLALAESGHEVGCHTFSHLRLPRVSRVEIEQDLILNRNYVHRLLGDYAMTSFAYPFGAASISTKNCLCTHFAFCRGIWSGVNKGRIDFAQLRAVQIDYRLDYPRLEQVLDEAQRTNGWLIFFTHDVSDTPSPYGCTTQQLALVLETVVRREIAVLPVRDAGARVCNTSERLH